MIRHLVRRLLGPPRKSIRNVLTRRRIERQRRRREPADPANFDFARLRDETLAFVDSLQVDRIGVQYRYSYACAAPSLYASAYACMTCSLLGRLRAIDNDRRQAWIAYFDACQDPQTGLFNDPAVANAIYADSDWWGARHLALHLISAYTDLGARPRHPFHFLASWSDPGMITNWLDRHDWNDKSIGDGDLDNKIMNIGCLLQFQRDRWHDDTAARALDHLKNCLLSRIDPRTGMWGGFDVADPHQRSRLVQFAYHLFPLYLFDGYCDFQHDRIVDLVLQTQNSSGGYGVLPNSSACEDIDSADILMRFAPFVSADRRERIGQSIRRAWRWNLLNQMDDGGFVFRINEAFAYGSANTSSRANAGALLPTWFRILATLYMARHLSLANDFVLTPCPGYEF